MKRKREKFIINPRAALVIVFVTILLALLLCCSTAPMVPYGATRVTEGTFLGAPWRSTTYFYQVEIPVYVPPPVEVYYSYPAYSAGFEWQSGRLVRHRTWGPRPRCR